MPRKMTTRGQNSKVRVDLEATGDDVKSMPKAKKKVTYEALRLKFDNSLEKSLQCFDDELASLDRDFISKFNQFRCRLSQTDLKMTLKEFLGRMDNRNRDLTQNGVMAVDKLPLPPGAVATAIPALATLHDKLLPITPAKKRKVLPNEAAMSFAGSPVSPETSVCPKTTLLMNGKEIDEAVFGDKVDIPALMTMLGNIMMKSQKADKL